jgi:hypothetical protein
MLHRVQQVVDRSAGCDDPTIRITIKISMLQPERIPCGPKKDELCFARIKSAFEMNNIPRGDVAL